MSFRANILLNEFGQSHDIDDMSFDADGVCSFFIDEKFDITLIVDNDERIYLYALVCKSEIEDASRYSLVLLSANLYLYGADKISCCYDHQNTSFVLLNCIEIDQANSTTLSDNVEKMIDAVRSLQESLAEMGYIEQ